MASLIYDMAADLWTAMKHDYHDEIARRMSAADEACTGYLVNSRGKAKGITAWDLFTGSADRAYRYATRELVDHWHEVGRISLAQYEAEWLDSQGGLEAFARAAVQR